MRYLLICAVIMFAGALAWGQTPATVGNARATDAPPTLEQMQGAVSRIRGGRIQRPASWEALSPEQKSYVQGILSGPRGDISGPLSVMLVSPGLGDVTQRAMAFARFSGREGFSSVAPKYAELGILMVARHWTSEYVWNAHHRYAVSVGLPAEVVDAIRRGVRPASMELDVEAIYTFAREFLTTKKVSDATLQAARRVLQGDRGVVELTGTMGLYQISSMLTVLDQTPLAEGAKPLLPPIN